MNEELIKMLNEKRTELVCLLEEEIKTSKEMLREPKRMKLDTHNFGDNNVSPQIILERIESHQKCLRKYDEALQRVRKGTYGICEDCGEDIPMARLRVVPFANLCVTCKEEKEESAKVHTSEYSYKRIDRRGAQTYA